MRISFIGAGAVGGALAALCARAGHEVTAVARGATAERIAQRGLALSGAFGDYVARIPVADAPGADAELVVVSVRTFQLAAALEEYREAIGDAPVLVVQNGLDGPSAAAEQLRRAEGVLGGIALFPATIAGPGDVVLTGSGRLRIGAHSPTDAALRDRVVAAFAAAIPTQPTANLVGGLWMKLLVNEVNALPAITGWSVQRTCRHPLLAPVLAASLDEGVRVADAHGVRLESVGVLAPADAARIRAGRAEAVVRGRLGHAFGTRPNPASMLQSIRRGQPTEIDALNGAIVRAGAARRIPTPVNAALVELVHAVEHDGRFRSPTAVRNRCRR